MLDANSNNYQSNRPLQGKVALVTGGSRGVGASVCRLLATAGADIVINYRSKGPRAEQVAESVRNVGSRALLAQADITDGGALATMMELVKSEFGHLDFLILNASGGLEKDKAVDYAMQLNLNAQEQLVELAIPLLRTGGRIVFVTSHLAHFHGELPVYPAYEPVAASKKAGENALRARIPALIGHGLSLVVVSGDMIEGTITPKLLERTSKGHIEKRRQLVGALPTVEEFAAAIANAATDENLQSGDTVYVGSTAEIEQAE